VPKLLAVRSLPRYTGALNVAGRLAYIGIGESGTIRTDATSTNSGLVIQAVGAANSPTEFNRLVGPGVSRHVHEGRTSVADLAGGNRRSELTDPTNRTPAGKTDHPGSPRDLELVGNKLVVAYGAAPRIEVWDLSGDVPAMVAVAPLEIDDVQTWIDSDRIESLGRPLYRNLTRR
jgi:hypothetical protein